MTPGSPEDLQRRLLASFKAEQRDHISAIRAILDSPAGMPGEPGSKLDEAFRRAHSLKGAARAVDLAPVETLAHCVETIFARVRAGSGRWDEESLKAVGACLDAVEDWVADYFAGEIPREPVRALGAVERLLGTQNEGRGRGGVERGEVSRIETGSPEAEDSLRVSARTMARLTEASERISAEVSRQAALAAGLAGASDLLGGLRAERDKLKKKVPPTSGAARVFDALDGNIRGFERLLRELGSAHERAASSLRAAAGSLRSEVAEARMLPVESVFPGLRKMARDVARDEGKEVELRIEGFEVRADRLVLEAIKDPLTHILRNSIGHGIEAPEERERLGKPRAGSVRLSFRAEGRSLRVGVADDGAGVDWKAAAERAVKRGLLAAAEAEGAGPDELAGFLFMPGFSTSPMVTDLAGRGMGLSVVAETAKRLQGRASLTSKENAGTRIELELPISISSRKLVFVEAAGRAFALPASALSGLHRISPADIRAAEGRPAAMIGGVQIPLAPLALAAGLGEFPARLNGGALSAAVLRAPGGGVALAVDAFTAETESVVEPLRGGAERVKLAAGAVTTDEGRVVLVLDPAELLARFKSLRAGQSIETAPPEPARRVPSVLVVDDSVTTRTLERGILEAHGYAVSVAVDGEDAMKLLRTDPPDLAIVDLQMPRMDGFELIGRMKREPGLARIPVIIVTSLESPSEKERGLALGADAYIVKRKFDHKGLLSAVRQILL